MIIESAFVIMPFGNKGEYEHKQREADFIFHNIVSESILSVFPDCEIEREVDKAVGGSISRGIVESLEKSDLCIVDITGQNANVFFELGVRYVFRKRSTILICQKGTAVPFDISNYRIVYYDPMFDGIENAKRDLQRFLLRIRQDKWERDSVIYDVFPDLLVKTSSPAEVPLLEDRGDSADHMSWSEYYDQAMSVVKFCNEKARDLLAGKRYIVGLSNGGMIFGELIFRNVFLREKPLVCLWQDRFSEAPQGFENSLNNSVFSDVFKKTPGTRVDILLVDDVINTGVTMNSAVKYLEKFPKPEGVTVSIAILPLVLARGDEWNTVALGNVKNKLVWAGNPSIDGATLLKLHGMRKKFSPYGKDFTMTDSRRL